MAKFSSSHRASLPPRPAYSDTFQWSLSRVWFFPLVICLCFILSSRPRAWTQGPEHTHPLDRIAWRVIRFLAIAHVPVRKAVCELHQHVTFVECHGKNTMVCRIFASETACLTSSCLTVSHSQTHGGSISQLNQVASRLRALCVRVDSVFYAVHRIILALVAAKQKPHTITCFLAQASAWSSVRDHSIGRLRQSRAALDIHVRKKDSHAASPKLS